jgi:protein phosphatase
MATFNVGAATDKGRVRSNNQDSKLVVDGRLFAVADGMGGHRGGEVASAVALETLEANVGAPTTTATLLAGVAVANEAVYAKAANEPELRGMGTTLCIVAPVDVDGDERVAVVNVGDSRVYLLRGDAFEQLTDDHSLVESLVRQGRLSGSDAETHPQRNILTRALGIDARVEVDSWELPAVTGDRFLLCSDGLFNEVGTDQIAATLRQLTDPQQAADELVRMANEGGGRDNITAVVVDVVAGTGNPATPATRTATASEPDLAGYGASEPTGPAPPPPPPPPTEQTGASVFGDDAPPPKSQTAQQPAIGVIGPEQLAAADAEARGDRGEPSRSRSRRVTWRVVIFVVALLALIGVVLGVLWYYGRNTFFVDFNADGEVTIFRGQPGGFLFFDPTVEDVADINEDQLQDDGRARVEEQQDFSSLSAAETFVANLCPDLRTGETSEACQGEGDDGPSSPTTTQKPSGPATTKPPNNQ